MTICTYTIFGERFAEMKFVRIDEQCAVMISVRLTQFCSCSGNLEEKIQKKNKRLEKGAIGK